LWPFLVEASFVEAPLVEARSASIARLTVGSDELGLKGEPVSLEWNNSFEIGEPTLDSQLLASVRLMIELKEAMASGRSGTVIRQIFYELAVCVCHHFELEEKWFRAHKLKALPAHWREHEQFSNDFVALDTCLERGHLAGARLVLRGLMDRFYDHIQQRDRADVATVLGSRQRAAETAYHAPFIWQEGVVVRN
jgi:hemerythrin-like metal-binding protein